MAPSLWEQTAKALAGNEALQRELADLQQELTRLKRHLDHKAAILREAIQHLRRDDVPVTLSPAEIVQRLLGEHSPLAGIETMLPRPLLHLRPPSQDGSPGTSHEISDWRWPGPTKENA
jgi:hypothetical protein